MPIINRPMHLFMPPEEVLLPGLHRWPFTFTLPPNAVSSFALSGSGKCPQGNGESTGGSTSIEYACGWAGLAACTLHVT